MKALVGAFNQEKALVGAFSVIVQPVVEPMDRFAALNLTQHLLDVQDRGARAVLRWCVTGTRRWAGQQPTSPGMFRLSPVLAFGSTDFRLSPNSVLVLSCGSSWGGADC